LLSNFCNIRPHVAQSTVMTTGIFVWCWKRDKEGEFESRFLVFTDTFLLSYYNKRLAYFPNSRIHYYCHVLRDKHKPLSYTDAYYQERLLRNYPRYEWKVSYITSQYIHSKFEKFIFWLIDLVIFVWLFNLVIFKFSVKLSKLT